MICSRYNFYAIIRARVGLKCINMNRLYSEVVVDNNLENVIYIAPSNLYLSIDYLKDKYTLLDKCILDSPHYSFINAINSGLDIRKTDYYKRFIKGYLDGRYCQRERNLSYFYDKNQKARQSIERGDYRPVVVYSWKNRYYICDGKHRAALCAFLNKEVKCRLIPPISDFRHTAINRELYRIMAGYAQFSKHISYFDDEK